MCLFSTHHARHTQWKQASEIQMRCERGVEWGAYVTQIFNKKQPPSWSILTFWVAYHMHKHVQREKRLQMDLSIQIMKGSLKNEFISVLLIIPHWLNLFLMSLSFHNGLFYLNFEPYRFINSLWSFSCRSICRWESNAVWEGSNTANQNEQRPGAGLCTTP